jgi:lipoate-protein ligase A
VIQGRYIHNNGLTSSRGLAIDETLAHSVAAGRVPPTLHLYHYDPSVILGRYQNAAASLRLDRCEFHGISINRRATGGGTVFMTPDQVAFGLFLPTGFPGLPRGSQGAFEFLAAGFARALKEFGLEAEFMGKNDLTVEGKKIAGLAISQDMPGVTFFHTSLLVDFDLETMLDILNLPIARLLDRGISCFGQRMTTLQEQTGRNVSLDDVQGTIHRALEIEFEMPLPKACLNSDEEARVQTLLAERYENDEWIYSSRAPKRRNAFAERKTPGGLIQAHLCLSGGVIEMVLFTGDYFSRTRDIARRESMLKYCRADREGLERRFAEARAEAFIHRVDLPLLIDLIEEAATCSHPMPAGAFEE